MSTLIDGVLVEWGDRLFFPSVRPKRARPEPQLRGSGLGRAAEIRARIEAAVIRRAPQVMVKVTGGGRGLNAIAAHFRYISKNGRLEMEDELGRKTEGKENLKEVLEDWRGSGSLIERTSHRREALNIMLSMPRGTSVQGLQGAARDFAKVELDGHKYVMVVHDHQANPHVHISVRTEGQSGRRLSPRKADLQHWRETFAEKLRDRGIDAEATRQAARGRSRTYESLWRVKALEEGRLRAQRPRFKSGAAAAASRADALEAWKAIAFALGSSVDQSDRKLAAGIEAFLEDIGRKTGGRSRHTSVSPDRSPRVGTRAADQRAQEKMPAMNEKPMDRSAR